MVVLTGSFNIWNQYNFLAADLYDPYYGGRRAQAYPNQLEDGRWHHVAVRRWQRFTGKPAVLNGDGRDFEAITQERRG